MAYTAADLTAVETAIRNRLDGGAVNSYGVGSQRLEYMSLKDLRDLRREIAEELALADNPTGTALVSFRRSG